MAPSDTRQNLAAVRIRTLGRFEVEVDGVPLRIGARGHSKPLEMLKLLVALGGEGVANERLADALWPDGDGDMTRGAFTTTLYRLRKQIGTDALRLADARLSLDRGRCWVDAWAFPEALEGAVRASREGDAEGAWSLAQEALAVYRGPFLDSEFDLPEVLTAREKLHALFLRQIEALGALFGERDSSERAIALYRQALERDDLAEVFYRALMKCYRDAGQPGEAVSLFQRCREVLRAGGGIEPSPETVALHEAIVAATQAPGQKGNPTPRPESIPASSSMSADISLNIPEEPSIAVLPFRNISDEPEQEYFSDGITEDLITDLSKISRLSVISQNTAFTYKGKPVNVQEVGKELGVSFVLEGSVRKAGNRLRITAQLIETSSGNHAWAERYDRKMEDIFEVQDEITSKIVTALHVKLVEGEQANIWRRSTQNSEAYDLFLQGHYLWRSTMNREGNSQARALLERAISLDPKFARAFVSLAFRYRMEAVRGWGENPDLSMERCFELANQAIVLDKTLASAHSILGIAYWFRRDWTRALASGERAVSLAPGNSDVTGWLAMIQAGAGNLEAAVRNIRRAMRLAPGYAPWMPMFLGLILILQKEFASAVPQIQESARRLQDSAQPFVFLAAAHTGLDQTAEAEAAVSEVMRIEPGFRLGNWGPTFLRFKNPAHEETMISLLRKAGLPE